MRYPQLLGQPDWVKPNGLRNSSCRVSAGWVGARCVGIRTIRRLLALSIDYSGNSSLSFHHERHTHASMSEHVDQCVNAEQVDLATYQVANARLRDTEECGRSSLREPPCLNLLANLDHASRPQLQILPLLPSNPPISQHLPRTAPA